ncbi:hypothetical protein EW146_g7596 [Bondarzewia mesenterica]|uniref:Metal homeostatis protein bsd2 n=1 Tax=Bondarzewia mesenterica TaxID=1095465 RepID=A0A4V3XE70_9AGAM|nr:hypothetical protein EW146_g7596 [Bondarzewia mesenterica]
MSVRYAPLPNSQTRPHNNAEMEAAFDDSDDDDEPIAQTETRPLNPSSHSHSPSTPAAYDFENFDYASYPPPGSPPIPSSSALPNDYGNSNGLMPSSSQIDQSAYGPRRSWIRRTAASVLPASYVRRWGLDYEQPAGRFVGGGINNDGVFANVTAKPSRPIEIREGDEIYLVPEEAQKDVPPSYAAAQADSVPPYWETTIHAPSSPGAFGEMIIDALPTGSLFSFLWNMLVSISFQFVGFLLTYLLHTTHAARFGSRAGLGVTLIQYGFALRSRSDETSETDSTWGWRMGGGQMQQAPTEPRPTFETAAQAGEYYKNMNTNMTDTAGMMASSPIDEINLVNDATTDWLSFFLMTVGWFVLLTSILGFWRVKRWESNILASQRDTTVPGGGVGDGVGGARSQYQALASSLQRAFGMPRAGMGSLLRSGLGFTRRSEDVHHIETSVEDDEEAAAEEGRLAEERRRAELLEQHAHDPVRRRELEQAFRDEDQLLANMQAAGML